MRVAILTYNARIGDAIGNQVAAKVAFFRERGMTVRVFLQDSSRIHPEVRSHAQVVSDPEHDAAFRQYVHSADLILVEYSQSYPLLGWLPRFADSPGRVVFDYHGVTPRALWGRLCPPEVEEGARRRDLVWYADAALVHSEFARTELLDDTGFPEDRTYQLGYLLDLGRFSPGKARRPLRERLKLTRAAIVLFVGRLAPNKRVGLLVEALAALRQRTPPVHGVVLGDNSDLYHGEMEQLHRRAAELGIANRLHFLGRVNDDELLDAYRSADVLAMPSVHEGFCIPVIEAMACGLPVVAAGAAALPETVGDAGILFTPDSVEEFTRQLGNVLKETEIARAARRERGLARCAAFASARWHSRFNDILEAILHNPARERRQPQAVLRRHEVLARALNEANLCRQLPDGYVDVSTGWFAGPKRWLKRKLLGNFQRAYVDVLARRQTAFNQHLLLAVRELAETVTDLERRLAASESARELEPTRSRTSRSAESCTP